MTKAIIFDMDGVLINTPVYVWKTHNKLLEKFEKHVPNDKIPLYLGRSLEDQIALFEKNHNISIEKDEYIKNFENEMYQYLKNIEEDQDLTKIIKSLKQNFKLAVATSSSKNRADLILTRLGIKDLFEIIITSEDVQKHKPNPEIFLEAAKKLEVDPKECLVVEDAANGIQAGKGAGMKVIALKTNFQSEEDLGEADLIINDLEEIADLVDRY